MISEINHRRNGSPKAEPLNDHVDSSHIGWSVLTNFESDYGDTLNK